MNANRAQELGVQYFLSGYSCAEASFMAICEELGIESDLIPKVATPFAGGICGSQGICGAVTGSFMAVGAALGRTEAGASRDACYDLCKQLNDHINSKFGCYTCRDLLGYDTSDEQYDEDYRKNVRNKVCEPVVGECCRYIVEELSKHI